MGAKCIPVSLKWGDAEAQLRMAGIIVSPAMFQKIKTAEMLLLKNAAIKAGEN